MKYVVHLEECDSQLAEVVGGKAIGLGRLLQHGLRVPPGFAVTVHAYREFVAATGIDREIRRLLSGSATVEAQSEASTLIRRLFTMQPSHALLAEELKQALVSLGDSTPVAVRSSAISEDANEASFAGEHDTYLWVRGADSILAHVLSCWGSLFTPQALAYFDHVDIVPEDAAMAVVVQTMVPAEAAGVMMTLDPVNGDPSQVTIEGSYGLGLAVVGGEVTPDRFFVDKVTRDIRSRAISTKPVAYRFVEELGEVALTDVPAEDQSQPCLSSREVAELADLGVRVEAALGGAQDIEWAIGPPAPGDDAGRDVFLLQARQETVWSRKPRPPLADPETSIMDRIVANMRMPMRLKAAPAESP